MTYEKVFDIRINKFLKLNLILRIYKYNQKTSKEILKKLNKLKIIEL